MRRGACGSWHTSTVPAQRATLPEERVSSRRRVRRHARDVALGATGLALAVYLVVGVVADLIVVDHLRQAAAGRLASRLTELGYSRPTAAATPPAGATPLASAPAAVAAPSGGLDDAPVLAFWVPTGGPPVALGGGEPSLPRADVPARGPVVTRLDGRSFLLLAGTVRGGRYVVATSIQELGSVRATLFTAEGALLPFVLATFFVVAYAIGRRAAAPVERARTQQLDFTADASHELRTPLSVIEAEVGLALSSERDAGALRGALERVGGESRRLRKIVDDLLWLARADALPVGAPGGTPVELGPLAEEAIARFATLAAQRNLQLRLETDGTSPVVDAPADWLERLVGVLLDNACRYVEPGGEIVVRLGSDAGRCGLAVDDSGPGIPPAQLAGVFRRFHRASDTPGGAGLGLAIAETIVRSTGGRFELGASASGGTHIAVRWSRPGSHHGQLPDRARRRPAGSRHG